MNKALEQKIIGPLEELHTKEKSPKAVLWEVLWARRSKIAAKWARTRAWAGWWFFLDEEEACGCRNKWRGATRGPWGGGHALDPRGQVLAPLMCSQCQIFSNILEKIIYHFQGIWRTFIFGVFLYCTDNLENRQINNIFTLFIQNNRK